jgi:hypothetical protein
MQEFVIKNNRHGKIDILVEDLPSRVAHLALQKAYADNGNKLTFYPLAVNSLDFVKGEDVIVAGCQNNPLLETTLSHLSVEKDAPMLEGAYRINPIKKENNILAIVGGDVAGLLYAITHLEGVSKFSSEGLKYDGGNIFESPVFPYRIYWTWDHSTNWNLDYTGQLDWGCANEYCKPPEAFVDDYKRLVEHIIRSRANGVLIWGFLRDNHGGVEAGQEICRYAKDRGVKILPSVGTSAYGGFYYRGEHPFNVDQWLQLHPECCSISANGTPENRLCPSHPDNIAWLREGTHWLFETFDIDGASLEYGDFCVCYCDRCKSLRKTMGGDDPDYYKDMVVSHLPFIEEALKISASTWITYATYSGFKPEEKRHGVGYPSSKPPDFIKQLPEDAICMWTITSMVNQKQVPLLDWLDDGNAPALYSSPNWPKGLRPATKRSTAFLHQGSQWYSRNGKHTRHSVEISTIKEGCLRIAEAGMQGVYIHGEVSSRCVPYELNYLAYSHFSYHPSDSLRDFARAQLSPLVGGEELAQLFIEFLAKAEVQKMEEGDWKKLGEIRQNYYSAAQRGEEFDAYRRWKWLELKCRDYTQDSYLPFP